MVLDPRLPIIVGFAQDKQRVTATAQAREPLQLMLDVLESAARDAGTLRLLELLDLVVVVRGAWNYSDPGRLIAEHVRAKSARTALTAAGGNSPQSALNELARRIMAGEIQAGALVGGEGIYTRRRARRLGTERKTTVQSGVVPDESFGVEYKMSSPKEESYGLRAPLHYYALFENALRAERKESIGEHRERIAGLLCRFSMIAADNPDSWQRDHLSIDRIQVPGVDNQMVAFPYTKRMCSNWFTDQAAALLVCSVGMANQLGIHRDQWVFVHSGTDANDRRYVSNRGGLSESPAIRSGGSRAMELAGIGPDEIAHLDIYSCFSSAVQVATKELRIGEGRQLTVTGGMAYFGGPLNNYVTHSIGTIAKVLRSDPGSWGVVTANGGYLSKHAFGVYSSEPPRSSYRYENLKAEMDLLPSVHLAEDYVGPAIIEASTVVFDEGRPERAVIASRTSQGARVWSTSTDVSALEAATTRELAGTPVNIRADGSAELDP
jgi:acetyl-CoA C-acetyltransferase